MTIKNCSTCENNNDLKGCKLSFAAQCVYNGYSNYVKGKRLFFCERCKTNSVICRIGGYSFVPKEPRMSIWCLKCDDYPIVEGEVYSGYKLYGIKFED